MHNLDGISLSVYCCFSSILDILTRMQTYDIYALLNQSGRNCLSINYIRVCCLRQKKGHNIILPCSREQKSNTKMGGSVSNTLLFTWFMHRKKVFLIKIIDFVRRPNDNEHKIIHYIRRSQKQMITTDWLILILEVLTSRYDCLSFVYRTLWFARSVV